MLRFLKKFSVFSFQFLVFSFLLLVTFITPAFAQTPTPSTNQLPVTSYQLPTTISPTSPLYTDLFVNNMFHTFSCLMVGSSVIGQPCLSYQITKNAQGTIQSIPVLSQTNLSSGALGATTSLIVALYLNPPVKTADYLGSLGEQFGLVKEAHAQVVGSGAVVLKPILSLWQVSRNISYLMMIIIFMVIGLMVMFRNRINPQTVITAQAALPGLIIGLILITFSYFVSALLTDAAFVGTNLVGFYFQTAQSSPSQNLADQVATQNVLAVFSQFVNAVDQGQITFVTKIVFDALTGQAQGFLRWAAALMTFQMGAQVGHAVPFIGDIVSIVTGIGFTLATAADTPGIMGLVFYWVAVAILIYSMLKLLLRLISNYLSIIFLTITAPFHFLAASLPGRQEIATNWILNMLCNVLAFPAVIAVFYFVAYLLGATYGPFVVTTQLGLTGGANLPLLGGLNTKFINLLLAFGALTALPTIPDIICRTIGKVGVAGQLIGQELSGSTRAGQGYASQTQQRVMGAFSTSGQNYDKFRGVVPGHAPANITILGQKVSEIKFPERIPIIGGRQPFGKKL